MSWRRFFRRARWDAERAEELRSYLELETEENLARGMTPDEARAAAHRRLGNATRIREDIYEMNTVRVFETLGQDVRYAARVLRRSPAFTLVAVLSLALGIGANTSIFQLIDAVRLRTLPVAHPESLVGVLIDAHDAGRTGNFSSRYPLITNAIWEHLRDAQHVFDGVLAWSPASFDLSTGGASRPVSGIWVSGGFFETLGVRPALGRLLGPADDRRGCGSPGAVLSYPFWQREFGGDLGVVGRTLHLDAVPYTIVGVSEPRFFGLEVGRRFDVAAPLCAEGLRDPGHSRLDGPQDWWLDIIGRLAPGVTTAQARAELGGMSPALFAATLPSGYTSTDAKAYTAFTLTTVPAGTGVSQLRRAYTQPLWLLLGIAGLVLLVACGNLANLMLARASARERELAVRLAIGASRWRIVRQLLVESLVLAGAGAAAGAGLASWLSRGLVALFATGGAAVFVDLRTDWRILGFAAGLGVLTCLLFGLMPAIRATRTAPGQVMKAGSRGTSDDRQRSRLRRALVVGQIALSLVLVAAALLFAGTLHNLRHAASGMETRRVVDAEITIRPADVPETGRAALMRELVARMSRIPGVEAAASTAEVPLTGNIWNDTLVLDGQRKQPHPNLNEVGSRFFDVMRIPLVAGRNFDDTDTPASPMVAIVNEAFGRAFFGNPRPLGARFQFDRPPDDPGPVWRVVGVVRDTKYSDLRGDMGPIIFFPVTQDADPWTVLNVLVRTATDEAPTASILRTVREVAPTAIATVSRLDDEIDDTLVRERLMATLSVFFGVLAAALAAVGLYGVMAYLVARRRMEIGIRMALGANRLRVIRLVLTESAGLVAIGLVLGLALTVAAGRAVTTLLFGLTATSPGILAAAAAGLALTAALATAIPARRAARLNPTTALREE